MKEKIFQTVVLVVTVVFTIVIFGLAFWNKKAGKLESQLKRCERELFWYFDQRGIDETHLARFDSLEFDVLSNKKWDLVRVSHADSIVVNWPDGHSTKGIGKHIQDLRALFVFAPDTRIDTHPIRFGSSFGAGSWTCVTGIFTGTFTKPMPIRGGKTIPPTGRSFRLAICTVARWEDGKMVEKALFWDNQTFMRQIGLAR